MTHCLRGHRFTAEPADPPLPTERFLRGLDWVARAELPGHAAVPSFQLDHVTQQNAALVEQSAAAADSLRAQAGRLVESVAVFKTTA